jgi:hypothetical protein
LEQAISKTDRLAVDRDVEWSLAPDVLLVDVEPPLDWIRGNAEDEVNDRLLRRLGCLVKSVPLHSGLAEWICTVVEESSHGRLAS